MSRADRQATSSAMLIAAPCAKPLFAGARWSMAALGVACFALGAIGAVVPGMPTTVFLLAGSYLLARSCPELERRLRQVPLLAPYAGILDDTTPMSPRARRAALSAMWTSITGSVLLLAWRGARLPVLAVIIAAGVAGTFAIIRFRRHLDAEPRS